MQLYGVRGWGSGIAEAMLTLADMQYQLIDVTGFDQPGASRDALTAANPLAQIPTLVLATEQVITESAAIALMVIDQAPQLAPPQDTPERLRFYRLLIWLVANVYPTFTYGDYPERWAPSAPSELRASSDAHRQHLYQWLEGEVVGPFVMGENVSVLDAYLAAMVSWRPGQDWFKANCPKIAAAAERTRNLDLLAPIMKANGWL
ncbi:glutathione S-transferase [Devosia sp. 1635]|uniref:glutathione S-transferase family protein n=1 Tax=Devosia sp. 1635 TaxID=2726066 RepID=UPI0015660227|nr:glutathione S-transferase [Devosia sp. 1635]